MSIFFDHSKPIPDWLLGLLHGSADSSPQFIVIVKKTTTGNYRISNSANFEGTAKHWEKMLMSDNV